MLQCLQILMILLTLQYKGLHLILEVLHYCLLIQRAAVYLPRFFIIGSVFDIADSDLYTLKSLLDHLSKLLDLIDLALALNLLILIREDALLQLSQRTLQQVDALEDLLHLSELRLIHLKFILYLLYLVLQVSKRRYLFKTIIHNNLRRLR